MAQKSRIWRFSGALRVIALVLAALYAFTFIITWIGVFIGDTELIFFYIDIDSTASLEPWQISLGILFMAVHTGTFIFICLAANKFLKASKREGFFIEETITACRKLAYGLMAYWIGLLLIENYLPPVLTSNFPKDERIELIWFTIDYYGILLVGFILVLIAQALDDARKIDSDNKQFI